MIDKLLEFENKSKVLEYHFSYKKVLMWPFVRFTFYRSICEETYNKNKKEIHNLIIPSVYDRIKKFTIRNPFLSSKKNVMFIYSGRANALTKSGKQIKRIMDDYAKLFPKDTYLLEDSVGRKYAKRAMKQVKSSDIIEYLIEKKLRNESVTLDDKKMIDEFIKYLKNSLTIGIKPGVLGRMRKMLYEYSIMIKYYDKYFTHLFNQVQPKIVFIENGCYGAKYAIILRVLHEMNIRSAELQHGFISNKHEAYTYPKLLLSSEEYKLYMPDYLLLWGEYWSKVSSVSCKKVIVGYSQIPKYILKEIRCKNNKIILFVAGSMHKEYIKFLGEILTKLGKEYRVIFRLHPTEKQAEIFYKKFEKCNNFLIDKNENIWDSLKKSTFVVGDFSTSLFEAKLLGKKVVILKDGVSCFYNINYLGDEFINAEEFLDLLNSYNSKDEKGEENNIYEMFNLDWKKNFRKFIESI